MSKCQLSRNKNPIQFQRMPSVDFFEAQKSGVILRRIGRRKSSFSQCGSFLGFLDLYFSVEFSSPDFLLHVPVGIQKADEPSYNDRR